MAKGYWMVHVAVDNPDGYREYAARAKPAIEKLGGRYTVRAGRAEVPEGDIHSRHVLIEFPSYEAALSAYNSAEYQEIARIRHANADSVLVVVEGVE